MIPSGGLESNERWLMNITYEKAKEEDIEPIYELCRQLIHDYEQLETIDYPKVINWIRKKIENSIDEYTTVHANGEKAGYYHFYQNEDGQFEIDDLFVFPKFQNHGIGSEVVKKCCASVRAPIILYVFIKNKRAVSLYEGLGFKISETIHNSRYIMKNDNRKYYAAYEERYKIAHQNGVCWASDQNSPIVMEIIKKYNIQPEHCLLEIGCGEGRDSKAVLDAGYNLMAIDISNEAIAYCKRIMPDFEKNFSVLDCLADNMDELFDFIYGIAVIHMLVLDEDRNRFYQFIHKHLKPEGLALICTMGDGEFEMRSDISQAFELQEKEHKSGRMMVAGTSCRMVSFKNFEDEIARNGLEIIEKGITSALPNFNNLMFAVVKKM